MVIRVGVICPDCGFDGSIIVDDDYMIRPYPIYCPECDYEFGCPNDTEGYLDGDD